ncbi:7-carboxy-7-deazaguanine synthase [Bacteroidia bacterium]|nr:7-carboxy-7-deazaguanine synthase [Bacteroidia bacterium]
MINLNVKEIFYSLQGEGGRQGEASIFIRLTGCNLHCAYCDTDFEDGREMPLELILMYIRHYPCHWIVWTGGEPTLQLTDEVLYFFKKKGYKQAVESNGTQKLSAIFDYTVVSPKGKDISYAKKNNPQVDEVRLPFASDSKLPEIKSLPKAKEYFLSPLFFDRGRYEKVSELEKKLDEIATNKNIDYCVDTVLDNPKWRLSVQMHKLIGIE